jgi:glycosyltransferase 2 family protein
MKRRAILASKLAVAVALVAWLVSAGKLDFGALAVFIDRPALIAVDLIQLSIVVVLGAIRWRLLLRLAGVQLTLGRALQLHITSAFFNVVVPSGMVGDVVKAGYAARDVAPDQRAAVYLVGFVDRLVGVGGLVLVGAGAMLLHRPALWEVPSLNQLAIGIEIIAVVTVVASIAMVVALRRSRGTERTGLRGRLLAAARLVASRPRSVAEAFGLAITIHLVGIAMFVMLGAALQPGAPVGDMAAVYPLGMFTLLAPISYSGFGVGHVAFERLFSLLGMAGGATVFNVYLIGQTAPCLLGVLPYLTLRRGTALAADEAEREPEPSSTRLAAIKP